MKRLTQLILISLLISGCAVKYRSINPRQISYPSEISDESISYSYRFNILTESGNKRYAQKEIRNNIQIVSLSFTNKLSKSLEIGKDVKFYASGDPLVAVDSEGVKKHFRQGVVGYFLYSLIWLSYADNNSQVILPIGVPFTLFNMIKAGNANREFASEFEIYNLLGRSVMPGETVSGLIALYDSNFKPLELKVVE